MSPGVTMFGTDPTDGASAHLASMVTGWIVAYALPALVALLVLGFAIYLMQRFAMRAIASGGLGEFDGSGGWEPEQGPWIDELPDSHWDTNVLAYDESGNAYNAGPR